MILKVQPQDLKGIPDLDQSHLFHFHLQFHLHQHVQPLKVQVQDLDQSHLFHFHLQDLKGIQDHRDLNKCNLFHFHLQNTLHQLKVILHQDQFHSFHSRIILPPQIQLPMAIQIKSN